MTTINGKKCLMKNGRPFEMVKGDREICKDVFGVIRHKGDYCCDYGFTDKAFNWWYDTKLIDGNRYAYFYDEDSMRGAIDKHTYSATDKRKWKNNEFKCWWGETLPEEHKYNAYTEKDIWIIKYLD